MSTYVTKMHSVCVVCAYVCVCVCVRACVRACERAGGGLWQL